jgi:hypothetical protein
MLDGNKKLARVENPPAPVVDYRFRLEDPRTLFTVVAATYLMAVPAAFGWASVALALCMGLIQRVGFLDG